MAIVKFGSGNMQHDTEINNPISAGTQYKFSVEHV